MSDSLQAKLDAEKEKNKLLLDIINAIPEPVLAKDWNGNFVFANTHLANLYGTTPKEMIGKEDSYFTGNPKQGDFFKKNVQSIMTRFQPEMVYEDSIDKISGKDRHFQSIKIPFKNNKDELHIAVYARDITEVIELKNLAEFNAKRLRYALAVSEEGMWDWNVKTNAVLHNKQWEKITGVESSLHSFAEFISHVAEADQDRVTAALNGLLNKNLPYNIEFRFKRPDGKEIWLWDRGKVVEFDENNEPSLLVGIIQDISEQKLNQAKVESMAFYDNLTKLPNLVLLNDRLTRALERSKHSKLCGAVLFIGLDHFKSINDSYGHQAGDELLIIIADRLTSLVQSEDTVARFGGDEFVIVLNNLDSDPLKSALRAEQVTHSIRTAISTKAKINLSHLDTSIDCFITASIGISIFNANEKTPTELLQLADLALFQAKNNGRDSCAMFDPVMQKKIDYTTRLENDIRTSIQQNDFVLYYQPQFDQQHNLTSAEALIRWIHPELGLINPNDFITIAEESNLIVPLGNWVLVEACKQLKQWQSNPAYKHLSLSINVSAKQIWQKDFVSEVKRIVSQSGINPEKLKLEITESVLLNDIDNVAQKLNELVAFGLSFSLDDFGTGYSSLGYLKNLPIDELKIDQSFIRDLLIDESDLIMVKSIIDLGKNFNLLIVAEGVETVEHLDLLKQLGCDIYQGYYFNRPIPIAEFNTHYLSAA